MPWRRRRVTHEEVAQGRPPRPVLWPWLLLLLLLVVALILGAVWLAHRDTRPKVPDVVGQNTPSAVRELRDNGYVPQVHTRRLAGAAVGRVLSQDPDGGSRLEHGKAVAIVAAIGAAKTGVPTVVGLPVDKAFVRLQAAGFKGSTKKVASRRPRDTVLRQSPAGGTPAAKGSLVQLTISKGGTGTGQATVPRVVGLTEPAAKARLAAAGFRSKVTRTESAKPTGLVNSQNPAQGAKAAPGSVVAISVSAGPTTTTTTGTTSTTPTTGTTSTTPTQTGPKVPRVIGMGQAQAFTRLEQAGFRVDSFPVTSSRTRGLVIRQQPQAGTSARPKSTVRLSVSLGPGARPFRVVPDVRDMTETDAKRVLVRVGFTVRALTRADNPTAQGEVVVDQKPNQGARVRAGSQVAIYLGAPQ